MARAADEQRQLEDKPAVQGESGEGISLKGLRQRYKKKQKEVQAKAEAIQALAEQLGPLDNETIASERRIRLQELQSTKLELDRLRKSLNEAIGELTLLQVDSQLSDDTPRDQENEDELEKNAEYLALRYQLSQLNDATEILADLLRPGSPALKQLQQEIDSLERKREALRGKLMHKEQQKALLMQKATVQQLAEQTQSVEQDYQEQLAAYSELGGSSRELEARIAELKKVRNELQLIQAQIEALESHGGQPTATEKAEDSKRDVKSILRQMRILLEELEKAVSTDDDRQTQ